MQLPTSPLYHHFSVQISKTSLQHLLQNALFLKACVCQRPCVPQAQVLALRWLHVPPSVKPGLLRFQGRDLNVLLPVQLE